MLRKQTKKILVVMLFALTLVLAGRVDANAQTAAPAGETGKSGQQFCNSAVERCYAE
mgnify:CR=1 FL=1